MSNNGIVVVSNVKLFAESDQAICIGPKHQLQRNDKDKTWIPMSLIESTTFDGVGSIGDLEIPQWLTDQKELEYDE